MIEEFNVDLKAEYNSLI